MKLLLATSIKYPSELANRQQVTYMANALYDVLGPNQFFFGGRNLPDVEGRDVTLIRIEGKKTAMRFAWRYLVQIHRYGITHVYCREEKMLFWILVCNRLWYRIPVRFVLESHFVPTQLSWWWRYMLHNVSGVIVTSSAIKDAFEPHCGVKPMSVVPHGVAVEQFAISDEKSVVRTELNLPADVSLVGYTGTLHTMGTVGKGMDVVLDALCELPGVYLVAVGGDPADIAKYGEMARVQGVADRVIFRERVSRNVLARYQRACDLLLLPMPANQYATMLPLKVFEYMASGRPIVASRLPSVLDVLNENNAFFFTPGDPSSLVSVVRGALQDAELGEMKARVAFEEVQHATWDARGARIVEILRAI
ncbi:MAG: glycosyltransferase family 4 protein [bacterium]|nr:glycosyltransferase family 4 protein [bacterium]